MAKAKASKSKAEPATHGGRRPGSGPKPSGKPRLTPAVSVKAGNRWREWLAMFAASEETTLVGVIDRALAVYAAKRKFEAPPDREA